jgi:hypothetical protein
MDNSNGNSPTLGTMRVHGKLPSGLLEDGDVLQPPRGSTTRAKRLLVQSGCYPSHAVAALAKFADRLS